MNKKFLATGVSLLISLSIVFGSKPNTAKASTLNRAIEQASGATITPYSNIMGSAGGNGSGFTYYSHGVILYQHHYTCSGMIGPHYTVYLPHSFIEKINTNVGNWTTPLVIGGVAKLLGIAVTNPFAIAIGTVLAVNWASIPWKDNGSGVTLVFSVALLPDKIVSGCNYYAH